MQPLRVMIYDQTCVGRGIGLSHAWFAGNLLYQALGRFDASFAASNWGQALNWLAHVEPSRQLAEVQFWGHGKWGMALIDGEALSVASLGKGHRHQPLLERIRQRMVPAQRGLWWFRTCETFGAKAGHTFAQRWAKHFDCRVAGHTFVIGFWQSGLHSLRPGATPDWSLDEGLQIGTPGKPQKAHGSRPWRRHTIHCLAGHIPLQW